MSKYLGLILAIIGIVSIVLFTLVYPPSENLVSAWLIWSALSVSLVLPLAGLGIALSLVSIRLVFASGVFFLVGFYLGLINYSKVWMFFTDSLSSSEHLYLTLPLSSFFVALLLLSSNLIRKWLIIPIAGIIASMLAISIKLTDPTLHDPLIPKLGLLVAIWIILSFMLNVRSFYRPWFSIAIKIFASWLLAGSILYGGSILAIKYGFIPSKSSPSKLKEDEVIPTEDILIPDFTQIDYNDSLIKKGLNS